MVELPDSNALSVAYPMNGPVLVRLSVFLDVGSVDGVSGGGGASIP